jgi:magnesium-protoporphyrin O-methyltransferase
MTCQHCVGIEQFVDPKEAQRELRLYRKKGLLKPAEKLVNALREAGVDGRSLLDIGGGVGSVQHELFKAGVASAVDVDGSSAYIEAAQEEAERQGTRDRVEYHHGDFVEIGPTLELVDIVTLDRVLCCYPDVTAMVASSTALAGTFYGVVYPRKSLVSTLVVRAGNLMLKLKKNPFRVFIHDPKRVDAMIREAGFEPRYVGKTLVWHVVLYERANAVRQGSPMAEAAEAA